MGAVQTIALGATIISGFLSAVVLLGFVLDAVTKGWVRGKVRSWLGIDNIRQNNSITQVFIRDLGQSHNDLVNVVSEQLDVPEGERPSEINVERYHTFLDNGDVDNGFFMEDEE